MSNIKNLQGITPEEAEKLKIANISTRPNSTSLMGQKGLTANELKQRFDAYADKIRWQMNEIVEALQEGIDGGDIKNGSIGETHLQDKAVSLSKLSDELQSMLSGYGGQISYLTETVGGKANQTDLNSVAAQVGLVSSLASAAKGEAEINASNIAVLTPLVEEAKELAEYAKQIAEGRAKTEVFENKAEMESWIEQQFITTPMPLTVKEDDDVLVISFDGEVLPTAQPSCTVMLNGETAVLSHAFDTYEDGRTAIGFDATGIRGKTVNGYRLYFGTTEVGGYHNTVVKTARYLNDNSEISAEAWSPYAIEIGTNFLLRALDVPDYWWDGFNAQPLETQKVDLNLYAQKSEVMQGLNLIVAALEEIEGEVTV